MSRACTICTHPDVHGIEKSLIEGDSFRSIASQFGVSTMALQRHKRDHLARVLAESLPEACVLPDLDPSRRTDTAGPIVTHAIQHAQSEQAHRVDLFAELARQLERINLLSEAVDAWLRDPDDSARYDIGARAEDITVVYEDHADLTPAGNPKRKKASLQGLLDDVERLGRVVPRKAESSHADPRELLLKAADSLKGQMQLRITLLDKLYSAQQVEAFQSEVLCAIGEVAPDVRARIEATLRQRLAPSGIPLSSRR